MKKNELPDRVDFIVVGAGSAGAVVAARLSEDPLCRVLLLEAGGIPPVEEHIPLACAALQQNPATDWMYTADAGQAGRGLIGGRMMMPRGKMLGGSSGINSMAYVRGHPGDFDAWAENGARGWGYADVLPYFMKSESFQPSSEVIVDAAAHGDAGPLGVSVRSPVLAASRAFVEAAEAAGIPRGDYNGRERGGPGGVASLLQTTTRDGRRASTWHAFLEGEVAARPNLTIVTGAMVTRLLLEETAHGVLAAGVAWRDESGDAQSKQSKQSKQSEQSAQSALATREIVLCAGAIGSPHLLLLSGIGPSAELESAGVPCKVDSPHVGKHLKDHLQVAFVFPAPGLGVSMRDIGIALGPDALRAPAGPLPTDSAKDADLPPDLLALKTEATRQFGEWTAHGTGLASSSLYDASAWFSTGLGDTHTQDAQIGFCPNGYSAPFWKRYLCIDPAQYFDDAASQLADDAQSVVLLANPVQPRSEGEIVLASADPARHPVIRMNYFSDPHDMKIMRATMRRLLDIAAHWPAHESVKHPLGAWRVPPHLARKHGHVEGAMPADALLDDMALHYSWTVYHLTSTCRIGSVVDAATAFDGCRQPARGRCERHAQRRQRQHQCRVDHDRREGGRDDRSRAWHRAHAVRRRATDQVRAIATAALTSATAPTSAAAGSCPTRAARLRRRCRRSNRPAPRR